MNNLCNYFMCNGKKYYTGTIIKVRDYGEVVDAVFICSRYWEDSKLPVFTYKLCANGQMRTASITPFSKALVAVTNKIDKSINIPETKRMKDSEINGMMLGWMWYVFLMAIATIFNGNIVFWILISVVFFRWRANKIQKGGTYIEW